MTPAGIEADTISLEPFKLALRDYPEACPNYGSGKVTPMFTLPPD